MPLAHGEQNRALFSGVRHANKDFIQVVSRILNADSVPAPGCIYKLLN